MRLLIATGWAGSWPYVPEMIDAFQARGAQTDVFDIDELGPLPIVAKLAFRAPALRPRTTVALLKRRLGRLPRDYDAINIHYAAPIYRDLAPVLKARGARLVTSIWGSDFLRASEAGLKTLEGTFRFSDIVTTNNEEVRRRLVARFPQIESRLRIVPFGMRSLDEIRRILRADTADDSRRRLGLPCDRCIVTLGYNGSPAQQHAAMIDGLGQLSPPDRAKIFVVVPMTYGADAIYLADVRARLAASGLAFKIFDEKLSLDDTCRLRIASDFAVNLQTTDSLSASLQEHMFVGSTMIVGRWLPYRVFEDMGVPILRVDDAGGVAEALKTHGLMRRVCLEPPHAAKIYDHSSWSATAEQWLDLYRP